MEKTNDVPSQWRFSVIADKQKENEKLRESLSRKTATLERLGQEYAAVKGDNERLQRELSEKETHTGQLLREICSGRRELSRCIATHRPLRAALWWEARRSMSLPGMWREKLQGKRRGLEQQLEFCF